MFGRKKLLKQIQELQERVTYLENIHAREYKPHSWDRPLGTIHRGLDWEDDSGNIRVFRDRQLKYTEFYTHPQPKQVDYRRITNVPASAVDTDRIPKVTLGELARFVLDGTAIERKTKGEVVYQTSYSPDVTSEFVETKLGNISITERTD